MASVSSKTSLQSYIAQRTLTYAIYNLDKENAKIVVEKSSTGSYDEFVNDLPQDECRWGGFDLEFKSKLDGTDRSRMLLFKWSPSSAGIKQKLDFNKETDALKESLTGVTGVIQATYYDDINYETGISSLNKNKPPLYP
ncbi:cofilin [Penicillium longicatenatum]|nr:cofilin [Penicillium longicatenatum]